MERLSYPAETLQLNQINRNRIVLSSKDSPRKTFRRRLLVIGFIGFITSYVKSIDLIGMSVRF